MRHFRILIVLGFATVGMVGPVPAQTPIQDPPKAAAPNNPQLALWLDMKRDLQAPHGKQYFESNLRNAVVPNPNSGVQALRGTILLSRPAKRPTELVLALSDDHTPEVTVTLRDSRQNLTPLLRPIAPGTEMEFWGIAVEFSQSPFMLTFEVKAENGPSGANPRIVRMPAKAKP